FRSFHMAYITREEFRAALLALYKELHERTKTQRYSTDRKETTENPTKPIATITKLDPVSTIETRKTETEKRSDSDSDHQFWILVVAWATFVDARSEPQPCQCPHSENPENGSIKECSDATCSFHFNLV